MIQWCLPKSVRLYTKFLNKSPNLKHNFLISLYKLSGSLLFLLFAVYLPYLTLKVIVVVVDVVVSLTLHHNVENHYSISIQFFFENYSMGKKMLPLVVFTTFLQNFVLPIVTFNHSSLTKQNEPYFHEPATNLLKICIYIWPFLSLNVNKYNNQLHSTSCIFSFKINNSMIIKVSDLCARETTSYPPAYRGYQPH